MDEMRGVLAVRAHKRLRSEGIGMIQPMTLKDTSCNSRTKLSLGLNCYCTEVFIYMKTNTRSRSASATVSAKYPTCVYSYCEYQYTACLSYL